jgi:transposase-like protein
MLNPDEWKSRVVADTMTICPACESSKVTMGACAIGSITVHQEYTCESCQHEFTALFALATCYDGHPEL